MLKVLEVVHAEEVAIADHRWGCMRGSAARRALGHLSSRVVAEGHPLDGASQLVGPPEGTRLGAAKNL